MIYRKQGITVRWENGTRIRVTESGVAIEREGYFECYPSLWSGGRFGRRIEPAAEAAAALQAPYERLIIAEGYAEHEYGDRRWSEHTRRFHASLVHGRLRALVDHEDDVARIADALQRSEEQERDAPKHLRLARNVTAALLPHLPNAIQTEGGMDGYGNPIVEARGEPWPNFFRPSYRVRPVRMPLNLRLECERTDVDRDLPIAVALIAPPRRNAARVLIDDGRRVHPSRIEVTEVVAVAEERTWYPYGGGSFGAELMF